MKNQLQLPSNIIKWLNDREITNDIIKEYELSHNGTHIVIPVHNRKGEILFNKYRRDPNTKEGPKYKYEKGAEASLYGIKTLKNTGRIFIVEGELDALCMISKGYQALSSTGGASTFKRGWADYLSEKDDYEIFVCLDTDDAGILGALKIHQMIKGSYVIWLPKECKDLTEYFVKLKKTHNDFEKLILDAQKYVFPTEWKEFIDNKKTLQVIEKQYKESINMYMRHAQELREKNVSDKHLQKLIEIFLNKTAEVKRAIKYYQVKRSEVDNTRLERAKQVPIPHFIQFDNAGTAKCIWHNEKTGSMHYYEKQNRVKCFGCNMLGDVIDVVQQMNNCNLPDALKIILNDK